MLRPTIQPNDAVGQKPWDEGAVVCYARKREQRRFLVPVAAAGGFVLVDNPRFRFDGSVVVVVNAGDELDALNRGAAGTILMEHGLGQNYRGVPINSPWGAGRRPTPKRRALLVPGPYIQAEHEKSGQRVVAVGSVFLDAWHGRAALPMVERPVIAFSTHWNCPVCPETRSSWGFIKQALADLAQDQRWRVIGHYHPHERVRGTLEERLKFYAEAGIEVVHDWEEVMSRAHLYICDNSSSIYEFAALDRPTVLVSPPWYRRDVEHGLRFWKALPGHEVTDPRDLADVVALSLADTDGSSRGLRRKAMPLAWGELDGRAAERTVAAISEIQAGGVLSL